MGRLSPVARPTLEPSFRIGKQDLIFTVGSCFARNIEKQLIIEGYGVAVSRFRPPSEPGAETDRDLMLNRYVPQSIANELAWAFGDRPFPEASYYQELEGWRDLQLHLGAPAAPIETVKERRAALAEYMRLAAEAGVFIMTVGLAEAWFDLATGLYLNAAPPARARKLFPDRFQFHLLGHEEILAGLEQIHDLLSRYGRSDLRILVTVSPVALSTTFTGRDVLVANSYMKSALRTAVEAFAMGRENIDYLPSYESIVLSDRRRAWREDQAHVADEMVRVNVLRMLASYAEEAAGPDAELAVLEAYGLLHEGQEAAKWKRGNRALELHRAAAASAPTDPMVLLEVGRFLIGAKRWTEALPIVRASLDAGSADYGGWYCLAKIHYRRREFRQASSALAEARGFEPTSTPALRLSFEAALKLGRKSDAILFADEYCRREPHDAAMHRKLDGLRSARGLSWSRLGAARRRQASRRDDAHAQG